MKNSLLETPKSISKVVQKYTKVCIYKKMKKVLTEHIVLADVYVNLLKIGSPELPKAKQAFLEQANDIAKVFSSLNPCVLKLKEQKKMWTEHAEYVVEIATLINNKKYTEANIVNDGYTDEMAMMSMTIADGLADLYCCGDC